MVHQFAASQGVERRWAPTLDRWLREAYDLREATMDEQWQGIDRVAVTPEGPVGIDYKCDERAARTGNLFFELVSNDVTGREGWVFSSRADWLAYFIVPDEVWMFLFRRVRSRLPAWWMRYPLRAALNDGYRTQGVCVPRSMARRTVEYVASLRQGDGPVLQPKQRAPDDADWP
jgi:hypothetical protein